MESPVSKLVQRPFSTRTLAEQVSILRDGPPRPSLHPFPDTGVNGSKRCKPFDERLYDKHQWLTACPSLKKCFCWPCLLFNAEDYSWNRKGFSDWESFPESLHAHEVTVDHIDADLQLKVFYHKHIRCVELQGAAEARGDAERSRTRREALEALVDVVLDEVVLEPVLLKNADSPGKAGRFLELLKSSREYASCGFTSRETARGLVEQSPEVVDDVIKATAEVLKSEVKREAGPASHVSIILGEHSDVAGKRLMSTVLRYVRGSEACERFVGFTDSVRRTADDTMLHILDVLEEYDVTDKLVAYAIDGRVLGAEELSLLVRMLKDRFPLSFFTPWHCHQFGPLLLQSLTEVREVDGFAKAMASIRLCFRKDSLPLTALDHFLDTKVLRNTRFLVESLWCDRNDVVNATLQHRKSMVEFFQQVVAHPSLFAAADVARAYGFRRYLGQFRTVFLLCLFSMISNVAPYFDTVCRCTKRYLESSWPIAFRKELRKLRSIAYSHVWTKAVREMPPPDAEPTYTNFQALFELVIDKLTTQLRLRLESHERLRFNLLLLRSNWKSDVYTKSSLYWQLMDLLVPFLPSTKALHNEIQVVNQSDPGCPNYSLNALFEALVKLGFAEAVPNLFKVVAMSYTMPLHANYNVSTYNKYDAIQEWSFCGDDETDRARAVLSLEVELLRRLKNDPNLKERVLEKLEEG